VDTGWTARDELPAAELIDGQTGPGPR